MSVVTKNMKVVTDAAVVKIEGRYKGRAGVLLVDQDDKLISFESEGLGKVTSNEGEYSAMLLGVTHLKMYLERKQIKLKGVKVTLFTDSSLVANQMLGNFRTKRASFIKYQKEIKEVCAQFKGTNIHWHNRSQDLAVLADFGSKHPRRTRSINSSMENKNISEVLTKVSKLLLKDDAKREAEEKKTGEKVTEVYDD